MYYLQYIPPRQPPSHLNIITTFSFVSLFLLQLHSGRGGSRITTTPSAARSTTATLTGARSCAAPSAPWRAMTSSPSRSGRGSSRRRRSRYGYSHGLPCKSKNLGPHSTFIKKATMQIAIAWEVPIEFIVHAPSKIAQFSLPHGEPQTKRLFVLIAICLLPELRGQGEDLLEAGGAHYEAALHVGHAQGHLSGTFHKQYPI